MQNVPEQDAPIEDLVVVETVPQMAAFVAAWHHNVIAQLKQMSIVPDEVDISFSLIPGTPERSLTPEEKVGFRAGVTAAIGLFEQLPFAPVPQEDLAAVPAKPVADDEEGTGQ